ncbi:MAG: prophage regulatory protein [Burkholderiaceae bacterium]|jgi:prophage regulatory protein
MKSDQVIHAIRKPEVLQRVGISGATMWRRIKVGAFPKPFKLGGGRAVAWLDRDITAWLEAQAGNSGA